ncbi:BMP family ABC transporter substrate-binding protein [Cohnella faecalis]|uniref:BMP family ABC transporter substrate-binding protein n=1 Tax=Cohnella faecalis TaxID=2315694 RepID=A0A398CR41_9BACL|nr:BMP family ABC transporter substrate-binding protein [Cohnella faecalis]RIE03258.1 BMP family ABC transporter substrate-binding protein [Cohnella faecalis]
MRNRTKSLSIGLVVLLLFAFTLAGCGSSNKKNEASPSGSSSPAVSPSATQAASPSDEKKLPRVAFVYIGPPGDGGWTFQHDEGRKYLEEKTGIKATTVENVPESADAERVITELAQNHDIIFTTSFGYMDYTVNVAKKFPKVVFVHCGGYKTDVNMATYFGKNWEASYLSGIAAGKATKTNHLGYVAAFPIPELIYNINAYTLGAQSVNPDVKVSVVWSNTWYDPTTERQAAISLLDKGADVLMAYQDSPATLQAAAERGAKAGGNDSDMTRFAPDAYLTNPVWVWGPFYVKTVEAVMAGTWKSESFLGSFVDGTVDLAPLGSSVDPEAKAKIEELLAKYKKEDPSIFTGPLVDQSGAEKVASGKVLTDAEVLSMDWFVKGVDGSIPK